jgi:hypothetical protein
MARTGMALLAPMPLHVSKRDVLFHVVYLHSEAYARVTTYLVRRPGERSLALQALQHEVLESL